MTAASSLGMSRRYLSTLRVALLSGACVLGMYILAILMINFIGSFVRSLYLAASVVIVGVPTAIVAACCVALARWRFAYWRPHKTAGASAVVILVSSWSMIALFLAVVSPASWGLSMTFAALLYTPVAVALVGGLACAAIIELALTRPRIRK